MTVAEPCRGQEVVTSSLGVSMHVVGTLPSWVCGVMWSGRVRMWLASPSWVCGVGESACGWAWLSVA